jgi:hypothetical protein
MEALAQTNVNVSSEFATFLKKDIKINKFNNKSATTVDVVALDPWLV